jgi:hypothetical protein
MRYFHRTSASPDDVLAEADRYFGTRLETVEQDTRSRTYRGAAGSLTLKVEAEGGHYTRVTVSTDKVGESEIDKVGKGFLTAVHQRVDATHVARGAY